MTTNTVSLDDLFAEAKAQLRKAKTERAAAPVTQPGQLYSNPANWKPGRHLAVIHQETGTLLGVFTEYLHRTEADCRRLTRATAPHTVQGTEFVSGSWWITEAKRPVPRPSDHTHQEAIIHVQLENLKLHSPGCTLRVLISYGAVARIELAQDTLFAQTDGAEELLMLPAGTNIQEEMSRDSKIALRMELAL